jgi:hypothetical protein
MESLTKVKRVGGSLMVTLPKELVEAEKLQPEQTVKIQVKKVKRSFFGAAKGIGPWTKEDKKWMEGKHAYE